MGFVGQLSVMHVIGSHTYDETWKMLNGITLFQLLDWIQGQFQTLRGSYLAFFKVFVASQRGSGRWRPTVSHMKQVSGLPIQTGLPIVRHTAAVRTNTDPGVRLHDISSFVYLLLSLLFTTRQHCHYYFLLFLPYYSFSPPFPFSYLHAHVATSPPRSRAQSRPSSERWAVT